MKELVLLSGSPSENGKLLNSVDRSCCRDEKIGNDHLAHTESRKFGADATRELQLVLDPDFL
jgi:hypothetical protein